MVEKYATLLLYLLIAWACNQNKTVLTTTEKASVVAAVRRTLDNYYADIGKEGLMAEFRYLDRSDDFFWVPPGYSISLNYDSVVSVLRRNAPLFTSVNNGWDTLHIIPLSATLATYTGRLHSVMTDNSGKISRFQLVETGLMIRRKDGWKLLSGQTAVVSQ